MTCFDNNGEFTDGYLSQPNAGDIILQMYDTFFKMYFDTDYENEKLSDTDFLNSLKLIYNEEIKPWIQEVQEDIGQQMSKHDLIPNGDGTYEFVKKEEYDV